MLRKSKLFLLALVAVFAFACVGATVALADTGSEAPATITYDGDGVQIKGGDATTNGVTDGTLFAEVQAPVADNLYGLFPGTDGSTMALAFKPSNDGAAFVLTFPEVNAADYDYMQISIAVNNWNDCEQHVYVFNSQAKELKPANAIYTYTASYQSTGTKVIQLPTEDLADENGKIRNITFKKVLDDPDQERNACQTYVDYIMFACTTDLAAEVLTDCSQDHTVALFGSDYVAAVPEENRGNWGVNNHLSHVAGSGFLTGYEGSEDGNVFRLSWGAVSGLLYPATMLSFPTQGEVNAADDIVVKMMVSADLQPGAALWFTSINTTNVWDANKRLPLDTVARDEWFEVTLRAKDFIGDDGKIANIGITVHLGNDVTVTSTPAYILFDSFTFREVVREVAPETSYTKDDISEIVPIGEEGFTVAGTWEGDPDKFDYTTFANVGFIRKDCNSSVVKFQMAIEDMSEYLSMYFVLRGTDKYNDKGGIAYWFSGEDVSISGGSGMAIRGEYPEEITSGEFFEVELGAITYRVDGTVSGYYGYVKINGELIVEDFFDNGDVSFGKHFGMYMHTSGRNAVVTVKPVDLAEESPLKVNLEVADGETTVEVGEYIRLRATVDCNIWGQGDSHQVKILSGHEFAEIDSDNYLLGLKDGVVTVGFTVVNQFGEFESNVITITVGSGEQAPADTAGEGKGGCGGMVGGVSAIVTALAFGLAVVLKKRG